MTTIFCLRKIKSLESFSEAAITYSVAPTRDVGGKIKWQKISNLPTVVRPLIAGLSIGEVSEPLPISGGLAIFQLRDLRERNEKLKSSYIDYVEFEFQKNPKINKLIMSNVMICDDLYSFLNRFQRAELAKLDRKNKKENSLPKELRNILSELDQNEFVLKDNDSLTTKVIMVCGRSEKENSSKNDMNEINRSLANKRLLNLARSYLENLRQESRIVFK